MLLGDACREGGWEGCEERWRGSPEEGLKGAVGGGGGRGSPSLVWGGGKGAGWSVVDDGRGSCAWVGAG